MPSTQINPFNYNIDNFDSGILGPISDSNFLNYLVSHNLPSVNPVIGGVLGTNSLSSRGTQYDASKSKFNVVDVPNLVDVAKTPSDYNNFSKPRENNLSNNLSTVNPQVGSLLGITTPKQAGLGQDGASQIGNTTSIKDLPSVSEVSELPSDINNFTKPRDINLEKNPELTELMTWHPEYDYIFYTKNDTYKTSYGLPETLRLGFVGNINSWVTDGNYVVDTHQIRDLDLLRKRNKWGPEQIIAHTYVQPLPVGVERMPAKELVDNDTGFISYSQSVKGDFRDQLLSRTLGVGVIPFSTIGSGINFKPDGTNISELDKIARKRRGQELLQRVKLNFIGDTVGSINLDPTSLLSGGKLIERDYTITSPNKKLGKAAQFLANLTGFNLPVSILQDSDLPIYTQLYGTNESMLDRTGKSTRDLILNSLNINLYGPVIATDKYKLNEATSYLINTSTPNRSGPVPNTNIGSDVRSSKGFVGRTEAVTTRKTDADDSGFNEGLSVDLSEKNKSDVTNYIGVQSANNDLYALTNEQFDWRQRVTNDTVETTQSTIQVENPNYDPNAPMSSDANNAPYISQTVTNIKNIPGKAYNPFKRGLLKYTQDIINNSSSIKNPGYYIGYFDSKSSFKNCKDCGKDEKGHITGADSGADGKSLNVSQPLINPSKGNQVRNIGVSIQTNSDGSKSFNGLTGGDIYCRSWASSRKYTHSSNLIRGWSNGDNGGNWWRDADKEMRGKDGQSWLTLNYDKNKTGMPKIAWDSGDNALLQAIKATGELKGLMVPYMFSIENLAWKDSPHFNELPDCEKGSNGGRIMWFPPYDIDFSDSTSISWDTTNFIGRGEPIYTYNHTERTGQISWKIVVDHPAVLNEMRNTFENYGKNNKDKMDDSIYHSFFAGCDYETIKKLFSDYIPQKLKTEIIPPFNETTFTPVTTTPPKDPEKPEITVYFENSYDSTERFGNPITGVGRNLNNDISIEGYEVTKSTFAFTSRPLCPGSIGLNIGTWKASPDYIYPPNQLESVNVLDDINKMAEFLTTADGKNYKIKIQGAASAPGGKNPNKFNTKLSKDRANNTLIYLKNAIEMIESVDGYQAPKTEIQPGVFIEYPLESQLYADKERWPDIEVVKNPTPVSSTGSEKDGDPCSSTINSNDANSKQSKLQRFSKIILEKNTHLQQAQLQKINDDNNKKFNEEQKKKRLEYEEQLKKEIVKTVSKNFINECEYFEKMKEDQPFVYNTFHEKIKNFHPAFHAITPEGLNSRLTFLQQCTRQGPQILDNDLPQNMVFGRPPICVLRIGDFYHTKIVIDSMNITYDPLIWDLNPEGIGVQPMVAKIDMGFKFIGGSSLGGPIKQLQNAVSFNFFANTSIYNKAKVATDLITKRKFIFGSFKSPDEAKEMYGEAYGLTEEKPNESSTPNGAPQAEVTTTADVTPASPSPTVVDATTVNTVPPVTGNRLVDVLYEANVTSNLYKINTIGSTTTVTSKSNPSDDGILVDKKTSSSLITEKWIKFDDKGAFFITLKTFKVSTPFKIEEKKVTEIGNYSNFNQKTQNYDLILTFSRTSETSKVKPGTVIKSQGFNALINQIGL